MLLLAACATASRDAVPAAGAASGAATAPAGAAAPAPAAPAAPAARGLVVPPGAGERLVYCQRPLVLTLKVDAGVAPTTRLLAGVGELRGDEGIGRHRDADEILYVVRGWGHAVFGGDTVPLGPGSMAHVPPGVPHRLVSRGATPLEYFYVLGPASSAAGFRDAATIGCAGAPATAAGAAAAPTPNPTPTPTPTPTPPPVADGARATWFDPGAGDRISYCPFPLVITRKADSASAPGTRLTAAVGSLRRGAEVGTHADGDEVVYVTHGHGLAFIGADTAAVEAGSVTFVPAGTRHGFVNTGDGTLEYVVVYGRGFSPAGFRRLAARPGPYCPAS